MDEEKIWIVERSDSGFRIRQTTRKNEAIKSWVAIVIGFIGGCIIYLLVTGGIVL